MPLDLGMRVVQYTRDAHRYGVIYKRKMNNETGWVFFEILWVSGERSTERTDSLRPCKSSEDQFADLKALEVLHQSMLEFHEIHPSSQIELTGGTIC
jgi:hypothetical protein